jgi:hypothetical protein
LSEERRVANRVRVAERGRTNNLPPTSHYLGPMNILCEYCGALHFASEQLTSSRVGAPKFGSCCSQGRVSLPYLRDPPISLRHLFEGNDNRAKEFRTNIRRYNAALAFTSLGETREQLNVPGPGPYVFKFHGELRHFSGQDTMYAQLYIIDPMEAIALRMLRNPQCTQVTMAELQDILKENHIFYLLYKHAYERLQEYECEHGEAAPNISAHLHFLKGTDPRRYNLPERTEIAVLIPENEVT